MQRCNGTFLCSLLVAYMLGCERARLYPGASLCKALLRRLDSGAYCCHQSIDSAEGLVHAMHQVGTAVPKMQDLDNITGHMVSAEVWSMSMPTRNSLWSVHSLSQLHMLFSKGFSDVEVPSPSLYSASQGQARLYSDTLNTSTSVMKLIHAPS